MTSAVSQPISGSSASQSDVRMAMIAGACVTVSIAALLARLAGILPAGPTTLIVLIGAAIGLKVAFSFAAKSASAPSRARLFTLVSNVGLAISAVTILAALPHLTKTAGFATFATDFVAELWALTVLAIVSGPVRTLGWRAFVGAGTTGFLGVSALAVALGGPVVAALGRSSLLAVGLWIPFTEEVCKLIPVAFIVFVAMRRTAVRPSALDLMMLGAWTGAGFALYEDAILGRGTFQLSTVPVVSMLFPMEFTGSTLGATMVHSGHLVFSALSALSIGLALLYRKHFRRAWLIVLVACLAVYLEHALTNVFAATGAHPPPGANLVLALTLGGYLSSLLLIGGIGYVLYIERRAIGASASRPEDWLRLVRPEAWLQLAPAELHRRAALLAQAQLRVRQPAQPAVSRSVTATQDEAV